MTHFEEAIHHMKELLKGGAHEGPCHEDSEHGDSCMYHVDTAAERAKKAREFLARVQQG